MTGPAIVKILQPIPKTCPSCGTGELLPQGFGTEKIEEELAAIFPQAAIERLGAQRDGVLRAHKRHKDGSLRDTVTYSIIAPEWPAIRERLDARLTL